MLVSHNEMRKKPKPDTRRGVKYISGKQKVIPVVQFLSLSALELTINISKSHWWAIKFEEVARKKWNI